MRYRIGEDPAQAALNSTDHTMILTLFLGVVIGIVLAWLGHRGRQWWLVSWSYGLVVVSVITAGWMYL